MSDPYDTEFELDLTDLPETPPEAREAPPSGRGTEASTATPDELLERLLEPYSYDTAAKALKLLRQGLVRVAKVEGQATWFNVQGSTLYICKITRGDDFTFAECSCPNGQHRGGDAVCYHSVASRAAAAGLAETWLTWGKA
jgi:hypothetical protein